MAIGEVVRGRGVGRRGRSFSVFSIKSILSAASILSLGSAGCILSIGSTGSILSIGSTGSSLGAVLRIGGAGRVGRRRRGDDRRMEG